MCKSTFYRWLFLLPLACGCLLQQSCTGLWRDAIYQGTFAWISGTVGNTLGSAELTNLLLGFSNTFN